MYHRKRNKNDLSTRRLSFNTSIPDTPDRSVRTMPLKNKKTTKTKNRKKNTLNRRSRQSNNISAIEEEPAFEIQDLLKKKWKIYRVSPLYNFQESKLKIYGKKLCEELCSRSNKFDTETSFTSLNALFSVVDGFNSSDDGSYALQVKLVTNNNKNNYIGYFITWENQENENNFTSLPILVAQGNKRIQNLVHQCLCKFFDCDVQPIQLSLRLLVVYLAKYLESLGEQELTDTDLLSFQYRLPGLNQRNTVSVCLSLMDTLAMFLVLLKQTEEDGENRIQMKMQLYDRVLYEKILFHLFKVYQLNLKHADLFKIVFPTSFLTSDGEIKWTTEKIAMLGLSLLQKFIFFD